MLIFELAASGLTASDVDDINNLLKQLTDKAKFYTYQEAKRIIKQRKVIVCAAIDGPENRVVGMATLKIDDSLAFTQYYKRGYIGDVVVNENYRGRGIAKALMLYLINLAKHRHLNYISLTSNPNNPKRAAAIKMYESLGFQLIGKVNDSNYYRLYLSP